MKDKFVKSFLIGVALVLLISSFAFAREMNRVRLSVSVPEIILEVPESTITAGKDAQFLVFANGDDLTYQWWSEDGILVDGDNVSGAAGDTLTLKSVACSDNGEQFWCVVSNSGGSVISNKFTLTVNHVFDREIQNETTLISKSTCTEQGKYYYSCSCGEIGDSVFFTEILPHHGGTATCNALAVCEDCRTSYGNFAEHIFGAWQMDEISHWKQCGHCGEIRGKTEHIPGDEATCVLSQFCRICGYGLTSSKGHSFTSYSYNSDASCLENGTETAKCDCCAVTDTRTAEGTALGHSFTNYSYNDDATCTEDGTETAVCDRCDAKITRKKIGSIIPHVAEETWFSDDTGHWQLCHHCEAEINRGSHVEDGGSAVTEGSFCTVCRRELMTATEHIHKLAEVAGKSPTCTESGIKTYYTCACESNFEDINALDLIEDLADLDIAPLGHSGGKATCQNLAVCLRCSKPYGSLGEHDHSIANRDADHHWVECSVCGDQKDIGKHYGGTADCKTLAQCVDCGASYGSLAAHTYGNLFFDDSCHWAKCKVCDTKTEEKAHYGGTASCDKKARCAACDKAYGELLPHKYDRKIVTEAYRMADADCFSAALYYYSCICGAKGEDFFFHGEPLSHSFDLWHHDEIGHCLVCSVCDTEKAKESHSWVKEDASTVYKEIFSCFCGAEKTILSHPFIDVSEKDWFYDDVLFVYHEGLLRGMSEDAFGSDTETSRAMIVTILYRLEGEPKVGRDVFDDVEPTDWYGAAVLWAAEVGVVNGYGNGRFGPDAPVTREQIAAILYRYAAYKNDDVTSSTSLSAFPDESDVSSWATTSLSWAVTEGLINGVSENGTAYLKPQNNALRCQIAAILHRYCFGFR